MGTSVKTKEKSTRGLKRYVEPIDGPEYSVYNFLRANTAFTIAVISGVVAVSSFVFRYASTLYNYEYLRFWDIDIAYAKQEDTGVFYIALGVFIYYGLLMLSQYSLGSTVSVYEYHNKHYLAIKECKKQLKKKSKDNKRIRKRLCKRLKKETLDKRRKRLRDRISKADERNVIISMSREKLRIMQKRKTRVIVNATISAGMAFLLSMLGAWILSFNYEDSARTGIFWALVITPICVNLLMFFIRKPSKIDDNQEINKVLNQYQKEVNEGQIMLFFVEAWAQKGIKYFLTNKTIGMLVVHYIVTTFVCIMLLANLGGNRAEQLHEFKVWTDSSSTYAILYDNGAQVVMEPINIKGDSAIIDASSQRIIKSDDLSYQIYIFDSIEVIRSDSNKGTSKFVETYR